MKASEYKQKLINGTFNFENNTFKVVNKDQSHECKIIHKTGDHFVIVHNNTQVGGFTKQSGKIKGEIDLSGFTADEHNTCLLIQLARYPNTVFFIPKTSRTKHSRGLSKFIKKSNYSRTSSES